jgi:hypothetical protein
VSSSPNQSAGIESTLIIVDVPCCNCASTLRGLSRRGQCRDCGMDNSKSLSIAAIRTEDPDRLEQLGLALDVDVWGVLLALLGCTVGPLFVHERFSFPAFGIVVAGATAAAGIWTTRRALQGREAERPSWLQGALVLLGSVAIVIPPTLLSLQPMQDVDRHVLALVVGAALLWFAGFCQKLHGLERVSVHVSGAYTSQRVQRLRWGCAAAALILALGMGQPLVGGRVVGSGVLAGAVGLMVFSLVTALLCSRVSNSARNEAQFARAIRNVAGVIDPRTLPDEPDWI